LGAGSPSGVNLPTPNFGAIRALVKREKTLLSDLNQNRQFHRNWALTVRLIRACVFVCLNRTFVSLSPRGDPFSQPSGSSARIALMLCPLSNRKKPAGLLQVWLLPARFFLGQTFH
jgi:hypothetical protein